MTKNPVFFLARWTGAHNAPRVATAFVVLLLATAGISALITSNQDWAAGLRQRLQGGAEAPDQDSDGLPDALENRIGSDLRNPATLGLNVSDGWLYHWFGEDLDWSEPAFLQASVLVPPSGELPAALREPEALVPPTLWELYQRERAWRDPAGQGGAWWAEGPALDPSEWDNQGDGVADAWLLGHGLDPFEVDLDEPAGDRDMTVREKYALGLDPNKSDTDGDGLADGAEINGVARFGTLTERFKPTDPGRFSSRNDGIADGYIVRFQLDVRDPSVASLQPGHDGITVREAYGVTLAHCLGRSPQGCDWQQRLREGPLKDPHAWDSVGDGVPDAWAIRDVHGRAPPLEHTAALVAYDTTDWDGTRWTGDPTRLSGVLVDRLNPAPKPFALTYRDLYLYHRPLGWNESADGPWWGGLPTSIDTVSGALPPALAARGWHLQIDPTLGREPGTETKADQLKTVNATADPRKADSDGDGLSDVDEYFGVTRGRPTARSNPADPDTDGDGLTDCQETLHRVRHQCEDPAFGGPYDGGLGTNVLLRSTSGGYLTDGQAFEYWTKRTEAATAGVDPTGLNALSLAPLGDLDGDGTANILDRDSDADGLADGMELFPNRFLPHASGIVRPATDPARADTDGDHLPDPWEVKWSLDGIYDCKAPCRLPPSTKVADGWPLHPGRPLSLLPVEGLPLPAGLLSDEDANLANDRATGPDGIQEFSNDLAYRYDLIPFNQNVPDPADGIPDMFAIVWGIENVPAFAQTELTRNKASELASDLAQRNLTLGYSHVVINPRVADTPGANAITKDTNLLGIFAGRDKGTWVLAPESASAGDCVQKPPSTGKRSESGVPRNPASPAVLLANRSGLLLPGSSGLCWNWVPYPMHGDMALGTNPWRHDTSGDGLPDAWSTHYGITAPADARLVTANCDLTPIDGQATITHCLTYAAAYEKGLDPTLATGDTDGGGVPDWLEVRMGLRPLDRADDSPEQAWSGNGLPNILAIRLRLDPLSPDSDGDGLLDGGDLTGIQNLHDLLGVDADVDLRDVLPFLRPQQGNGNLCLPGPSHPDFANGLVPNMNKRPANLTEPAPGPLKYSQLYDWYVSLGILHEPDHLGACPTAQHVLFKREALKATASGFVGAGRDSSSLQRDTASDGVPDGWLVHWLDRSKDSSMEDALSPATDVRQESSWDPDQDLVLTQVEHAGPAIPFEGARPPWGAPADWDEARDGTWWGGMDPASKDSAGSGRWFAVPRDDEFYKKDPQLTDLDNDGLPDRYDPFPAFDHDNSGILRRQGGGYATNHTALWPALQARPTTSFADSDGDRIPDFLDRARVGIGNLTFPPPSALTKGTNTSAVVTGTVRLAEPPPADTSPYLDTAQSSSAGNNAPVQRATVKVLVRDTAGFEAVAGAALTDANGNFAVPLAISASLPLVGCTPGASVAGRLCDPAEPTQPSSGLSLRPGALSLRVEVEANDPTRQPLGFGTQDRALAYKSAMAGSPFQAPDGLGQNTASGLAFVAAKQSQDAIDEGLRQVIHSTRAIFPASTHAQANAFTLRAQTVLALTDTSNVKVGDLLHINGTFLDKIANVPLPNHTVQLLLESATPVGGHPVTDVTGTFRAQFNTSGLAPGVYNLAAAVALPTAGFLEDPAPAATAVAVARETSWHDLTLNGQALQGDSFHYPAQSGLVVTARLLDHRGQAVAAKPVVTLVTQTAGSNTSTILGAATWQTLPNGTFMATLPGIPAGVPLGRLELVVRQATSSTDEGPPLRVLLRPVHATLLAGLENASVDLGRPAVLEGRLVRGDGSPAFDAGATFVARPQDKASPNIQVNGTTSNGQFRIAVPSGVPRSTAWTVDYTPGDDQLMPANGTAWTRHVIATAIEPNPALAVRDAPVELSGRLLRSDGTPVTGNLTAEWAGRVYQGRAEGGTFNFTVEKRPTGLYPVTLRFAGSPLEHPANATAKIAVREPTALTVQAHNVTVSERGTTPSTLLEGTLATLDGDAIGHRAVLVNFTGPKGRSAEIERPTDLHGAFAVTAADVPPLGPGNWTVHIQYAEALLEMPANATATLSSLHVVTLNVTRAPAEIEPGEMVRVRGALGATSGEPLNPVRILVQLGDGPAVETTAVPGQPWQVHLMAPPETGTKPIVARGVPSQWGVKVLPGTTNVTVVKTVSVDLVEAAEGTRTLEFTTRDTETNGSVADLRVILLRSVGGLPVETYEVTTDAQGRGVLELPADTVGEVTVISVLHPVYRLEVHEGSVALVQPPPPEAPAWVFAAGMAALAAALSMLTFLIGWRARQRRALAAAVDDARRLLLDPRASPARVIEAVYARLLLILKEAGDPLRNEDTVRDIAERATKAFRLPRPAMGHITRLFERAKYSGQELSQADRSIALGALHELAESLGTPVRVQEAPGGMAA